MDWSALLGERKEMHDWFGTTSWVLDNVSAGKKTVKYKLCPRTKPSLGRKLNKVRAA
tara:strand:+ start:291 stop:461 length:171 start_codon:yes stop_codon:yes gene_type:complete